MIELIERDMGHLKSRKKQACFFLPSADAGGKAPSKSNSVTPSLISYAINILFWSGLFLLISFVFFDR